MADIIQTHLLRYVPKTIPAHIPSYDVPFRKDWVVLDALNFIKDNLDGSLSFRWSCRMGVCGSCGMKVNGTPKLTCAAFLRDSARADSGRAAALLPHCQRPGGRYRPTSCTS